jgi:hypothetical protein
VSDAPERPWAGGGWDALEVKGPPRWRGWITWPLVGGFVLVLVIPFVTTAVWMVEANGERQRTRALLYSNLLEGYVAGSCVDEVTVAGWQGVERVDCGEPHDGEVTGVVALGSGLYPGADEVLSRSERLCQEATAAWVVDGPGADLDLDVTYFYPLRDSWSTEHPTSVCYATAASGDKVTGTLGAVR